MTEAYPSVACGLAAWSETEERIALVRLAAKWNNGSEHFDHTPGGYSWLCVACGDDALRRLNILATELDKE